jgi:hypothetical protein
MFRNLFNRLWDRWANFHPAVQFFTSCFVLALIGFFGLKPCYDIFKSWRMNQNLVAAKVATDEVRMSDARDLSLTVLRSGDPRIDAYRILEKSMESLRDPRHGDVARALMQHSQSTDEDRLIGFRVVAEELPLALVGQAWVALPSTCHEQLEFAIVFADRLIFDKKYSEAASILLAAQAHSKDEKLSLRLARILVLSEKKQGYDQAQIEITNHIVSPNSDTDAWLNLLERIPVLSLDFETLTPLKAYIVSNPKISSLRADFIRARIDYVASYDTRSRLVEQMIEQWSTKDPVALAGFLFDLGLNQRIEEIYSPDVCVKFPAIIPILLKVYRYNSSWDKLNATIDLAGPSMTKLEKHALRTFVARSKNDMGGAAQNWFSAMDEAKNNTELAPYLTLYKWAVVWDFKDYAELAMIEAIRYGKGPLPLYKDLNFLLNSLIAQDRENTLLEICANYLSYENGNVTLLIQYMFLACLNDLADPVTVLKAIEPLATTYPDENPIQCVLASVYLAAKQYDNAANVFKNSKLEPDKLIPSYRAIYLTTQLYNQRIKKSDPKVVGFPLDDLLPSEKKKLSAAINQAKD